MRIIETFLEGKRPEIYLCEDGFYVNEHYAVVIDGATSKSTFKVNGKSTGRYIMELIRDNIAYIEPGLTKSEFVTKLNDILITNYKKDNCFEIFINQAHVVPEANMVVYSKEFHELWFFGDCEALVDGVHYSNKKYIDQITSAVRKLVNEYYLVNGKSLEDLVKEDEGAKYIENLLKMQLSFRNANITSPFRYATISGFGFSEDDIKVIKLDSQAHEMVLATDGYPKLFMTLEESEKYLKWINDVDPFAMKENTSMKGKQPGMQSFDDRAYIRIRF